GHAQLCSNVPSFVIIRSFGERPHGADDGDLRMRFFHGFVDHGEPFFKYIGDQVFIADADVFQVEGFWMTGFGALLSPFRIGVTVGILHEVYDILYERIHFFHRDAALLAAAAGGGVLAGNARGNDRHGFGADVFTEAEVLEITEAGGLMVSPEVTLRLAGFQ